jgi:kinesin family member 6/9
MAKIEQQIQQQHKELDTETENQNQNQNENQNENKYVLDVIKHKENDYLDSDSNSQNNSKTLHSSIKIFVRVRPPKSSILSNTKHVSRVTPGRYTCSNTQSQDEMPSIGFHIPKDENQGLINNQKENYDYRFHRVFDKDTKQNEVFDYVAKDVILRYYFS